MKEEVVSKKIICLYTNDLDSHKNRFKNILLKQNNDNKYIKLEYSDWEYVVALSTSIENVQEKIDRKLIDKADIVVAIVGKHIEKKYLKKEIKRVFDLQIQNKKSTGKAYPLFFINFVPFTAKSNNDEDTKKFIEIYNYKKELRKKFKKYNDDIFFFDKDDLAYMAHHISTHLSTWYEDEIESCKEYIEKLKKTYIAIEKDDSLRAKVKDILEENK